MNIHLTNVSFAYSKNDHAILDNISYAMPSNQIIGLIGANGSGKSTLLHLIAGLISPTSGNIMLGDHPISHYSPQKRAQYITMMTQQHRPPFGITAQEMVLLGRHPYTAIFGFDNSKDIDIAMQAMIDTDCNQFADRKMNELSGGEIQRIYFARALAQQTPILLFDEPTTFLDIKHQYDIMTLLRKLKNRYQKTILCALHDIHMAPSICDTIIALTDGQLLSGLSKKHMTDPQILSDIYNIPLDTFSSTILPTK